MIEFFDMLIYEGHVLIGSVMIITIVLHILAMIESVIEIIMEYHSDVEDKNE